jgi:hypothetical protein
VSGCPTPPPTEIDDLNLRREGDAIVLSWMDAEGAADYRITRSTDPDPRTWGAPWRTSVGDEDPVTPGVQWTDAGAAGSEISPFFYTVVGDWPPATIEP